MFCLRTPSTNEAQKLLSRQRHSTFSYPEVGASASNLPLGYNIDRNRVLLGSGELIWRRSIHSIEVWQMFNIPWIRLFWPTSPIKVGTDVGVLINHFGFYSLNFARIVYVVEEHGPVARYGFAYGTLEEHSESGEERFTVEWDRADDKVWYSILAFSRPNEALAKLGYPLARILQKRFVEASKLAMLQSMRQS